MECETEMPKQTNGFGFIIGFMVISWIKRYGVITLLLFVFGSVLSYYLFDKKILKDIYV